MLYTYTQYAEKIKKLKDELDKTSVEFSKDFLKDFEDELSKYLKVKIIAEGEFAGYFAKREDVKAFLLEDEEYGYRLNPYDNSNNEPRIYIHTIYKYNNKYKDGGYYDVYLATTKTDLENKVKFYVEKLKKDNIKRLSDKEKRELKRTAKKYNL